MLCRARRNEVREFHVFVSSQEEWVLMTFFAPRLRRVGHEPLQLKIVLMWSHHLLATSKRKDIVAWSHELQLWVLSRPG